MDHVENLLKAVTEAHGVPGSEDEIRRVMAGYLSQYGKLTTDNLGSLICNTGGNGPRVVLMAHMDEIGFMVRHITDDGFIKFVQLGGWWDQVLLGHRVIVKSRKGDLMGVIGAKPLHLLKPDERTKLVEKADMYIDVGTSSADEVKELGVRIGDYIVPDSRFEIMANGKTYMSKAFDDRVGCAVMIETLQALQEREMATHLYAVASVLEEVGSRGAITTSNMLDPQMAFVLESGIAGDVPGITKDVSSEALGKGPVIGVYDALHIAHNRMRDFVMDIAEQEGISTQVMFMERGATDGAKIHINSAGVPTLVLAVSARHIHSHNSIIHRDDFDQTVQLLTAVLKQLDEATVAELTAFSY